MQNFITTILILSLFFAASNAMAAKEYGDGEECVKCHVQLWDQAMQKFYVHQPFFQKKCKLCHIEDNEQVEKTRGFSTDRSVEWLGTRRENVLIHWFSIPLDKFTDKIVVVDIQEPGKGNSRQEIELPPLEEINDIVDDKKPPTITNVRVAHIDRGLFLNATITWDTNKLCSSQIFYGRKKLKLNSDLSDNLTTKHSVILAGLKNKKKYKFKVVSSDMYENTAESKNYAFSTKKRSKKRKKESLKYPKGLIVKHQLYKSEENLMLKFASNKPVLIAVGVPKELVDEEENLKTIGEKPVAHNLKDAITTNSKICEPCHGVYTAKSNHPINVPPKPGMTIPEEYFVLANGNITCMTCHAAHSSNIEYRMLKSSKRELCVGCHVAKI